MTLVVQHRPGRRCIAPHIHYDSPLDIPDGINYVRGASAWRCIAPVRIIDWRLSRDCCLHDFPGYFPLKPISEYRMGVPIADRVAPVPARGVPSVAV